MFVSFIQKLNLIDQDHIEALFEIHTIRIELNLVENYSVSINENYDDCEDLIVCSFIRLNNSVFTDHLIARGHSRRQGLEFSGILAAK